MLTTMIGFGCMLIAEHRGIRSLGFVMLAGLGVTLLACYIVLPAILRLRTAPWTKSTRPQPATTDSATQ
jgi:predicted RND superfamily exporter protein